MSPWMLSRVEFAEMEAEDSSLVLCFGSASKSWFMQGLGMSSGKASKRLWAAPKPSRKSETDSDFCSRRKSGCGSLLLVAKFDAWPR